MAAKLQDAGVDTYTIFEKADDVGGTWRAFPTRSRFPSLFMLMGPHSPVGSQSLVIIAEDQADYVTWWINQIREGVVTAAVPTEAATKD